MDPEIRKATELLFAQRLKKYRETLDARKVTDRGPEASSMTRGAQLADLGYALRIHCLRVLTDYLALLELFDALATSDGVGQRFDTYVDEASSELFSMFDVNGRAERNRLANQASGIKTAADAELANAIERSRRARQHSAANGNGRSEELDDRLPLGRRGSFDRELARTAEQAKGEGGTLALVMIDIDHFKSVNDTHGHPVGDEVLLEVAKLIVDRVAHKGKAYRYGGEEFVLILPSYSTEEACGLAERIRKDIEGAVVSSKQLRVTSSFGTASLPDDAADAKALLEEADGALYRAKAAGRNYVGAPYSESHEPSPKG